MPRGVYERQGTAVAKTTEDAALVAGEKVGGVAHRTHPVELHDVADGSVTGYLCLKPMKVNGVKKNPGDLVPEAVGWRNVHNYLSAGYLAAVLLPSGDSGGGRF